MNSKIYTHIRLIDKDDAIASLQNYAAEIARSEERYKHAQSIAVNKAIGMIRDIPFRESIPVDFVEEEIYHILKFNKKEADDFAMHLEALVNTWRNKSKSWIQPDHADAFVSWACRWVISQEKYRDKGNYLAMFQELINAWNEEKEHEN